MIVLLVSLSIVNLQILTATEPNSPAAGPGLQRALLWISSIGGFGIVIGIFMLTVFPAYFNKPIKKIIDGIKDIANHNYDCRLNLESHEFAEVSENFNRMAKRLSDYHSSTLAQIKAAKNYMETIINSVKEPIIGLNNELTILFINDEALNVLNLKREEVLQKPAQEISMRNDLLRRLIRELMDSQTENRASKAEPLKIYADNKESYFQMKCMQINKQSNNINEGYVIMLKNITEFKELDSAKTTFISTISHELKTPIALIQGYAEGLKEGVNDDPESREFYCEVIMDEAGKMNRMVKNLLALNQLEFGEDDVQFERFDITSLISGVLQSLDILIEQKEAQVIFRHKNPVYVWADEFKVEQVVRNYVNNALNHIDGEKVIEIKITQENDMAKITVFNTGTPIPEEDLPHIWEKFYKVDKARTREYGGNGIGLSIVKAIMDSFGKGYGAINHTNGVEFWFELDMK